MLNVFLFSRLQTFVELVPPSQVLPNASAEAQKAYVESDLTKKAFLLTKTMLIEAFGKYVSFDHSLTFPHFRSYLKSQFATTDPKARHQQRRGREEMSVEVRGNLPHAVLA